MEKRKLSLQERILESDTDKWDWNCNVGNRKVRYGLQTNPKIPMERGLLATRTAQPYN